MAKEDNDHSSTTSRKVKKHLERKLVQYSKFQTQFFSFLFYFLRGTQTQPGGGTAQATGTQSTYSAPHRPESSGALTIFLPVRSIRRRFLFPRTLPLPLPPPRRHRQTIPHSVVPRRSSPSPRPPPSSGGRRPPSPWPRRLPSPRPFSAASRCSQPGAGTLTLVQCLLSPARPTTSSSARPSTATSASSRVGGAAAALPFYGIPCFGVDFCLCGAD